MGNSVVKPVAEEIIIAACPTLAEDILMAHRILYYVRSISNIPDHIYDQAEREFLERDDPATFTSPLHKPGSDNIEDYSLRVKALALYLQACRVERLTAAQHATP